MARTPIAARIGVIVVRTRPSQASFFSNGRARRRERQRYLPSDIPRR
jgi:hypothetical protein